jgi:cytochrome c-type biogenesis protein CcmH
MLWLALGALTLAVVGVLLRPLLHGPKAAAPGTGYDLEVYRDQLAELKREEARGLIGTEEARAAEREIARRLLAAADAESNTPHNAGGTTARRWTALGIATVVPLAALGLYLLVGAPGVPGFPFAKRAAQIQAEGMPDIDTLIGKLEAHLKEKPDDLEGWLLLARTEATLQRYGEAEAAYAKALPLSGRKPGVLASYAEMMMMAGGGVVTEVARELFKEALTKEPGNAPARFYLALAEAQAGNGEAAVRDWLALAAEAPADAPWLPELRAQIDKTAKEFKLDLTRLAPPAAPAQTAAQPTTSAPGPTASDVAAAQNMTEAERTAMIRGMVGRLAARLKQQPDDLDGWRRLGHAYDVLGEHDKAVDALAHAAKLAPKDPAVLADYGNALYSRDKAGEAPPAEAVEVMRTALALDAKNPDALWVVGLADAAKGDKAAAADLWNRLLAQLSSGSPQYEQVKRHLDALKTSP